jgi:hypothetical protein
MGFDRARRIGYERAMGRIHVNRDRQNLGQFTPEEISEGLASSRFLPTDLAWREGMETWQPLSTFTDLPLHVAETDPEVPAVPAESISVADAVGSFPWDRRAEIGIFNALWETISQSLGQPSKVFTKLPEVPTMAGPYRFYLLLAISTGAISLGLTMVFVKAVIALVAATPEVANDPQVVMMMARFKEISLGRMLFALLVVVPLTPFVAAGVCHALLALVGGTKRSFSTTFAVTCYVLGAVSPFQLLLCCGTLVQGIWALISLSSGFAAAHRTEAWRAAVAVTIAFLICCGLNLLNVMASMQGLPGSEIMPR